MIFTNVLKQKGDNNNGSRKFKKIPPQEAKKILDYLLALQQDPKCTGGASMLAKLFTYLETHFNLDEADWLDRMHILTKRAVLSEPIVIVSSFASWFTECIEEKSDDNENNEKEENSFKIYNKDGEIDEIINSLDKLINEEEERKN
jgi:hypothetical protein